MEIEINLWNDYVLALRSHLVASGFHLTGAETDDAIVIGFFNWQKRKVRPVPRKIILSQEFNCPSEFEKPIAEIKNAIEQGQDITHYLSKKIGDFDYSDLMLNDWGVHHMHLGDAIDSSGFIKRTGPLLFVKFTEANAYFINIFIHGAWSKQEIVATIHKNWPNVIAQYRIKDVISLSFQLTDDEIATLRPAHINTIIQLDDGTVYAPIGQGSALDGTAIDVKMHLIKTKKALRKAEEAVQQTVNNSLSTFSGYDKLKFVLELNELNAHAVEENSRIAYKLW